VLHEIAESGVLVVITPMPLNLAIFNPNAANAVMEEFPQITSWYLAGHSLGGAAAGIYAENHSTNIQGIAFWDSYPPQSSDLSGLDLLVYSIYGTTDGFPNTDNFDENRALLPADAHYFPIEGASHAQFGDYGPQAGDVEPAISLSEQHEIVVDIMLAFVHAVP
jgi:pimeloyl-ACP methyl ester carboxylesterase